MHTSGVTQVAVLALLASTVIAAPTPSFPGAYVHGAPGSAPIPWAWNATRPTPQEPDPPSFGLDLSKLAQFTKSQLEALQSALEHNHTLPALDLTPSDLAHHRSSLLSAVGSYLHSRFHKRNDPIAAFGHLSHEQLEALYSAITHDQPWPFLNLTESVIKQEKPALLAALEKFIHPTPQGKKGSAKKKSEKKRTPWGHPFFPAASPANHSSHPEIPAGAPWSHSLPPFHPASHSGRPEIPTAAPWEQSSHPEIPTAVPWKGAAPSGFMTFITAGVSVVGTPVSFPLPSSAPTSGFYFS